MKLIILDLDGTLLNPYEWSIRSKEFIRNHLKPEMPETLISEAEKYTLNHPVNFSWIINGLPAAFVEDSYQWRYAQSEYLWASLKTDESRNDFYTRMYYEGLEGEETKLIENSKELVEYLFENAVQTTIVTNARTTKAERFLEAIGFDEEISIYGSARKFITRPNHPFQISNKIMYSDRPHYHEILENVMSDFKVEPKEVTVIGDVYSMDLSLPHRVGMGCILVENDFEDGFKTPQVFTDYVKRVGIPVVTDLNELIHRFSQY